MKDKNNRILKIRGRYWSMNRKKDGTLDKNLFGYAYEDLDLKFNETAFILVDLYGPGLDEGDPLPENPTLATKELYLAEKEMISKKIKPMLDIARKKKFKIIHIANNSDPYYEDDYHEYGKYTKRIWGISIKELHGVDGSLLRYSKVVAPMDGEYLIKKRFYDAFKYTEFDYLLKNLGVKNIIGCGVLADGCLFFTLYEAYVNNYKIVLIRDATLALEYNDEYLKNLVRTKHSIETIEMFMGHSITSREFIDSCRNI